MAQIISGIWRQWCIAIGQWELMAVAAKLLGSNRDIMIDRDILFAASLWHYTFYDILYST
jgi:hypothetical protein